MVAIILSIFTHFLFSYQPLRIIKNSVHFTTVNALAYLPHQFYSPAQMKVKKMGENLAVFYSMWIML